MGDGVSDINLHDLLAFHRAHGKLATLTAVRPPARFGHLELDGNQIVEFSEKPQTREGWINGAFLYSNQKCLITLMETTPVGKRTPGKTRSRWSVDGLQTFIILAVYGHNP